MPRPPRIDIPGMLYHVIARGNRREVIFRDAADYSRYEQLLSRYQQRHGFTLYAFVLMPNHLHLLLSPTRTLLAKTMQGLQQSYTGYFNRRYRMVGHCFQGRFKAILCETDAYLLELIRYLHLNPVRAGLVKHPAQYRWSSHRLFLGGQDRDGVAVEACLRMFSSVRKRAVSAYSTFVEAGIPVGHRDDLYEVVNQQVLGDERFAETVERTARHTAQKRPLVVSIETIAREVSRESSLPLALLRAAGRSRRAAEARAIIAYLAREETALPLTTTAEYLNRDPATISLTVRRFEDRVGPDANLSARVDRLRRAIRRQAVRRSSE